MHAQQHVLVLGTTHARSCSEDNPTALSCAYLAAWQRCVRLVRAPPGSAPCHGPAPLCVSLNPVQGTHCNMSCISGTGCVADLARSKAAACARPARMLSWVHCLTA